MACIYMKNSREKSASFLIRSMEEPRSILKRDNNEVDEKKLEINEDTVASPPLRPYIPHHKKMITHRLGTEIENIVRQQANKAFRGIEDKTLGWKLILEEDDLRIYRREEEINGIAYEPIKAFFTVSGITAFELCHIFFSPKYRCDWDVLVDDMVVIEEIDDNSLILMQKYKRVCFSSQRDSVFWSHMRHLENGSGSDQWIVVNHSTEHPDYEVTTSKCVRLQLTACLCCQTQFEPPVSNKEGVVCRDQIRCKITYCATINPGGWVAPFFLKPFYKKECSRFLKRLTTYAKNLTKNNPISFS